MNELLEVLASFITNEPAEFLQTLKTEGGEWLETEPLNGRIKTALSDRMKAIRQSGNRLAEQRHENCDATGDAQPDHYPAEP